MGNDFKNICKFHFVFGIIYDYDGGETVENPSDYTVITPTITLLNPSRQGYIFSGWYHAETNEKIESIPLGSVGNISLYAVWEPKGTITIYNGQQTDIYGDVGFEIISDQTTTGFEIQYKIEGERSTSVPVAVGVYDVMITREECEKYLPFSITIPEGLKVVKATPSVTFTDIDKIFNGERISVDHAVFNVTLPTALPISVNTDGVVNVADVVFAVGWYVAE